MDTQSRAPLDLSAKVIPCADVLVQELDGEAVLLNLDSERYFGLDDVGTRIWQHLLEHRQLESVCNAMSQEYAVEESRLRADVLQLTEELIGAGIVSLEVPDNNDPGG